MKALTALHSRSSVNLLTEPGPTAEQLNNILLAGLRACDHGNLRPWKYLLIDGSARRRFGELMVAAKAADTGAPVASELADKLRSKPFRAPTILVVVAEITKHPKIPDIEQVLSAGASAQMIVTAAYAQGLGAIWRSGSAMFQPVMKKGLGLTDAHQIVGFIYLGTPKISKISPTLVPADFLSRWEG